MSEKIIQGSRRQGKSGKAMEKCFLLESQGKSGNFNTFHDCCRVHFLALAISGLLPRDVTIHLVKSKTRQSTLVNGLIIGYMQLKVYGCDRELYGSVGHLTCLLNELKGIAPKFTIKIHSYTISAMAKHCFDKNRGQLVPNGLVMAPLAYP